MKNYRTTLIGALLAAVSAIGIYQSNGGELADWKQWVIPVLLALLGYLAKDAGVSGTMKIIVPALMLLALPSCGTLPDGQKTFLGITASQGIGIGVGFLKREAATVDDERVQKALALLDEVEATAAKNPVNVQP